MGKIAKPKKRETSIHSRAFRRNATPPPELPAGKKEKAGTDEQWMYNAQNAGVHKKSKAKRGVTRQQHARHAKALERADRNFEVLENKIAKSKVRGKNIVTRAKDWEELNEELAASVPAIKNAAAARTENHVMDDVEAGEDVEDIEEEETSTQAPTAVAASEESTEPVDIIT